MNDRPPYHHGDLRNALLQAGLDILEQQGLAALTLRAVAARAGVSHAAPAHHFKNLRALLSALATIGYERFAAAIADERTRSAPDAVEQLRASARGYLHFASANPGLFRLMFSGPELDWKEPDGQLKKAASAAFQHLAEVSAPAAAASGDLSAEGQARMQTLIWSTAHGYARLVIDAEGALPCLPSGEPMPMPDLAALLLPAARSVRQRP